ncbi:BCLAF1 and THRAP3 family member 3-like isoform X1 [Acipenser ruthenus]|uniref:BCLAF1 and THRAP3 family member 3-like isoform X1 n=1 Tax=Acipenser ruthenus TaxID=7906 RepID=UPI002742618D|nr:BCLAF1 and THRAP3 family member 3-like isoform X1 [Acipenser ruthenus]XP_058886725.1 BCLAF1 and THRAP3 family member 3-like isoform X1 [Acipenser ruthenus]
MSRPRSRSPRHKYRSVSSSYERSEERLNDRPFVDRSDDLGEYKKGPEKQARWSGPKDEGYGQNSSRMPPNNFAYKKKINFRPPILGGRKTNSESFRDSPGQRQNPFPVDLQGSTAQRRRTFPGTFRGPITHRRPPSPVHFHGPTTHRPPSPEPFRGPTTQRRYPSPEQERVRGRPAPPPVYPSPGQERDRGRPAPPRYPEEGPPREYERIRFQEHRLARSKSPRREINRGKPFSRPGRGENWQEGKDFAREERYSVSPPRRGFEEYHRRSPYEERNRNQAVQPGYPAERGFRKHSRSAERARDMERYEERDPRRSPKWKQDRSYAPYPKEGPRQHPRQGAGCPVDRGHYQEDKPPALQMAFEYSHKHSRGVLPQTHEKPESREKESQVVTSKSKEENLFRGGMKTRPLFDRRPKPAPLNHASNTKKLFKNPSKIEKDEDLRSPIAKQRRPNKLRSNSDSSRMQPGKSMEDSSLKRAEFKQSGPQKPYIPDNSRGETLTIKVDMKRPMTKYSLTCHSDRQLSQDLVAVGQRGLAFHPAAKHSGSSERMVRNSQTGDFAQEIITLVHQDSYFMGGNVTLNDRFSKLQDSRTVIPGGARFHPGLKISRQIDIPLSEMKKLKPNKKTGPSQQVSVHPRSLSIKPPFVRKRPFEDKTENGKPIKKPFKANFPLQPPVQQKPVFLRSIQSKYRNLQSIRQKGPTFRGTGYRR